MRLIGEAVLEDAGSTFENFGDLRGHEHRAEWRVAAGNSLPYQNDVGRNVPVLDGERLAGTAHAAHDFVGDQQYAALAANFGDTRRVPLGRDDRTERGADDRFEDKGGDRIGVVAIEEGIQIVRTGDAAFRGLLFEGAVITEARRDMVPLRSTRVFWRRSGDVSADGHGAERAAVVALPSRNDSIAG